MASERMRHLMGVARSAAWIAGIQAVNFLIPLAALPFIVRGLGVEQFSVYAVLMACATFLVVFADFSFNVTGPLRFRAAVAEGRLGTLVLDSMVLKGGLIVPAAVVFLAGALTLVGAGVLDATLALAFAVTVTMTPRWVVYSLGRLRAFAVISAVTRLAWFGAVVWQVRGPEDLSFLLTASVAAQAVTLAGSFAVVWPRGAQPEVDLRRPVRILGEDVGQFGAILAVSGGRELNLMILSALATAPEVASYALADRVRVLMVGLVAPVTQALFLAIAGTCEREAGFRGPASVLVLLAAAAGGGLIFAISVPLVHALGGGALPGAVPVLQVLCLLPFLNGLTAILGANTLLLEGRGNAYATSQLVVALLGIPLTVVAVAHAGPVGAAWSAVTQEATLATLYAVALRRSGLLARVLR
jgi:PST family polysaccharide transporter